MSRIRTVKPELFKHEELYEAEIATKLPLRLAFIGLFVCCDREGRFKWRPQRLKLDLLPYDNINLAKILDALLHYGFINKYEVKGNWYGYIPTWSKHQLINHREIASDIPAPNKLVALTNKVVEQNTTVNRIIDTSFTGDSRVGDACFTDDSRVGDACFTDGSRVGDACFTDDSRVDDASQYCPGTPGHARGEYGIGNREYGIGNMEYGIWNREHGIGKGNRERNVVTSQTRRHVSSYPVKQIFEYWKNLMQHPNAKLDDKRKSMIQKALNLGYSAEELCNAISGCSVTPHNMGDNKQGQRYDSLQVILRDADQIDRFIANHHKPPCAVSNVDKRIQGNIDTLTSWVNKKIQDEVDDGQS